MAEDIENAKNSKQIRSFIDKNIISIRVLMEDGSERPLSFDFAELPPESRERLALEGACDRLGRFASGKTGKDAVEGIEAGWALLLDNNFKERRKEPDLFSKKELLRKLAGLSPEKQQEMKGVFSQLGLPL